MNYRIAPPPEQLARLFLHTLWIEVGSQKARFPAGLSPSIMLFVRGGAAVLNEDGSKTEVPRIFLRGPFVQPIRVEYEPGTIGLGTCFIPGMLEKACDIAPSSIINVEQDLSTVVDRITIEELLQAIDAHDPGTASIELFHHFLSKVFPEHRKHALADAFMAAHQKMFFPLVELSSYFGVGERQIERRVKTSFGVNLRDLRKIARFGFTVQRILREGASWGDLTRVAQESGYYDQAHMHKEFTELAGIAPSQLIQKIIDRDPEFWVYLFTESEFKKLFIAV